MYLHTIIIRALSYHMYIIIVITEKICAVKSNSSSNQPFDTSDVTASLVYVRTKLSAPAPAGAHPHNETFNVVFSTSLGLSPPPLQPHVTLKYILGLIVLHDSSPYIKVITALRL